MNPYGLSYTRGTMLLLPLVGQCQRSCPKPTGQALAARPFVPMQREQLRLCVKSWEIS